VNISRPSLKKILWLINHPTFKKKPIKTLLRVIVWEIIRLIGKPIHFVYDKSLYILLYPNDGVARLAFYFDYHEPVEFAFLSRFLDREMICVDVGANIGTYSLFMAKRVKQVFAFEPQLQSSNRLIESSVTNNLLNITVIQNAVSSHHAKLRLSLVGDDSAKTFTTSIGDGTTNLADTVEAVSLDEYFTANPVERIDYIKIDAEGAESEVLLGSKKILKTYKPIVQLEIAADTQTRFKKLEGKASFNFEEFFTDANYQFFCIDPTMNALKRGKSWNTIAISTEKIWELQAMEIIVI